MALLLSLQGQIRCPHGGTASVSSLSGSAQHQIDSINVLCEHHVGSVGFSCPADSKCVAVTQWIPNQTTVRIMGKLVLTENSVPITNNGPGKVTNAGQKKVRL